MKLQHLSLAALAIVLLATSCKDTLDELTSSKSVSGSLSSAKVVPSVAVPSSAKGDITGTYASSDRTLNYLITYGGLTGNIRSAAFYYGDARHRSLSPIAGLPNSNTSTSTGQFSEKATLTQQQADSLLAGRIYFSISTDSNPNGEIRTTVDVKQ